MRSPGTGVVRGTSWPDPDQRPRAPARIPRDSRRKVVLSQSTTRRPCAAIAMVEPGAASPGIAIARALKAAPGALERVIGVASEADAARLRGADLGLWTLAAAPDPSRGAPFLDRLRELKARTPVDVLLAARGADVTALVPLADELGRMGIRTFLPTAAQLELLQGAARAAPAGNGAT